MNEDNENKYAGFEAKFNGNDVYPQKSVTEIAQESLTRNKDIGIKIAKKYLKLLIKAENNSSQIKILLAELWQELRQYNCTDFYILSFYAPDNSFNEGKELAKQLYTIAGKSLTLDDQLGEYPLSDYSVGYTFKALMPTIETPRDRCFLVDFENPFAENLGLNIPNLNNQLVLTSDPKDPNRHELQSIETIQRCYEQTRIIINSLCTANINSNDLAPFSSSEEAQILILTPNVYQNLIQLRSRPAFLTMETLVFIIQIINAALSNREEPDGNLNARFDSYIEKQNLQTKWQNFKTTTENQPTADDEKGKHKNTEEEIKLAFLFYLIHTHINNLPDVQNEAIKNLENTLGRNLYREVLKITTGDCLSKSAKYIAHLLYELLTPDLLQTLKNQYNIDLSDNFKNWINEEKWQLGQLLLLDLASPIVPEKDINSRTNRKRLYPLSSPNQVPVPAPAPLFTHPVWKWVLLSLFSLLIYPLFYIFYKLIELFINLLKLGLERLKNYISNLGLLYYPRPVKRIVLLKILYVFLAGFKILLQLLAMFICSLLAPIRSFQTRKSRLGKILISAVIILSYITFFILTAPLLSSLGISTLILSLHIYKIPIVSDVGTFFATQLIQPILTLIGISANTHLIATASSILIIMLVILTCLEITTYKKLGGNSIASHQQSYDLLDPNGDEEKRSRLDSKNISPANLNFFDPPQNIQVNNLRKNYNDNNDSANNSFNNSY